MELHASMDAAQQGSTFIEEMRSHIVNSHETLHHKFYSVRPISGLSLLPAIHPDVSKPDIL